MTIAEQPITRTELREELRRYATKADIAELRVELHQMDDRTDGCIISRSNQPRSVDSADYRNLTTVVTRYALW